MISLYMTIGLPGSGKSHWASEQDAKVVSSDAIREELFGDVNDQNHNNEVFNEVHNRIQNYLKQRFNVVYDATNLSSKRRKGFLNTVPKFVRKVAVVFCTDYDICLKRNAERDRHVPEEVIERMYKRLTLPTHLEGFDQIEYVFCPENNKTELDYYLETVGYDQDNPHHSLTLDKHLEKAYNLAHEKGSDLNGYDKEILCRAALVHDVGKPVCKTYELFSGKVDNHAHYYNHANVGAYKILCSRPIIFGLDKIHNRMERQKLVAIATLIQLHMNFFDNNFSLDEYRKYYENNLITLLEILHECDVEAH